MNCCRAPKVPPVETFPREEYVSMEQILDEDFECMHRMAQSMCLTLGRPKDREICRKTLEQLATFQQMESVAGKENVRKFMTFYLKVLRWTQKHQPLCLYKQWYGDSLNNDESTKSSNNLNEMHMWLQEDSSYMAMKTFDDGSVIVYTAVAKDPTAGWTESGFKTMI